MKSTLLALITGSLILYGQAPDNTKTNQRDRAPGAVTADQQKLNKADQEVAQKIRKAVNADKSLSTYAHNVKIIVNNGAVTLRGPVRADSEKLAIGNKATSIAGTSKVTNELTVAPDTK